MDRSTARRKFASHKANAANRGIAFEMTFDEWLAIWGERLDQRGVHKDQLGMCRTRDLGSYKTGNVRLDTPKGNAAERGLEQRCSTIHWRAAGDRSRGISHEGFRSQANRFLSPDQALEQRQEEYEWIPGE